MLKLECLGKSLVNTMAADALAPWLTMPLVTIILIIQDKPVILVKLGQYCGCWCPGSLHRQDISTHDIGIGKHLSYLRKDFYYLCHVMWTNKIKCEYMFMFPLKNLARKELTHLFDQSAMCHFWSISTISVATLSNIKTEQNGLSLADVIFKWWKCLNFSKNFIESYS